jgi:hypothetical protein
MDAYLIIGNPNTRKASLVRSLTGCFNRSVRDILIQGSKTPLRFYARVGALQDTRTTVEDFAAEVGVLGQNSGGVRASNLRQYPQAPTAPINVTAREVRAQFGWA